MVDKQLNPNEISPADVVVPPQHMLHHVGGGDPSHSPGKVAFVPSSKSLLSHRSTLTCSMTWHKLE